MISQALRPQLPLPATPTTFSIAEEGLLLTASHGAPGFASLRPVEEVWAWLDAHRTAIHATETVETSTAAGRIAAVAVHALADQPATPVAAADGYALMASATLDAGTYAPVVLTLIGSAAPNHPFDAAITPTSAVEIAAGAPLPAGADTVLTLEQSATRAGLLELTTVLAPGENIRPPGADWTHGLPLCQAYARLDPMTIGLLVAAGITQIGVIRRPTVRLIAISTAVDRATPSYDRNAVHDANLAMLKGLIARDGGEVEQCLYLYADDDRLPIALCAPGADIIVTSGASGRGFNDGLANLVSGCGTVVFHGIALKYARSTGIAQLGDHRLFMLSGFLPSGWLGYEFFAGRAIRQIGGHPSTWPYPCQAARTAKKIVSQLGLTECVPVRYRGATVEPIHGGNVLSLATLTQADGLVMVGAGSEGYPAGAEVPVYRLRPPPHDGQG